MGFWDWFVLVFYLLFMIGLGFYLGKAQKGERDYYLGGRAIRPWQVALSIVSTQISAISLIGAPAFVALKKGGGIFWLQYELAVPLAMVGLLALLVPVYHREGVVSIYGVLERRLGREARKTLSLVFLASRGLATGVVFFATSVVASVCLSLPLSYTILITGLVTLIYTTMGGIKADIYSDIIQFFIFLAGIIFSIGFVLFFLGDFGFHISDPARLQVLRFKDFGLRGGETYGFWPMLLGGFFLYLSYYGCDQSQAQRLLTTSTLEESQKALVLNGLLRFPVTLIYLFFGLLLIPFLKVHPDFMASLKGKPPDFLVPIFIVKFFPAGLKGLMVSGIFAATMSSADSALNSLSAITWEDFLKQRVKLKGGEKMKVLRLLTVAWGGFAIGSAFLFMGSSKTVIELVNMVGSLFYGPILAVFLMAVTLRGLKTKRVIQGFWIGIFANLLLWLFFKNSVSWMWWNFTGFLIPLLWVFVFQRGLQFKSFNLTPKTLKYARLLLLVFLFYFLICVILQILFS